MPANLKKLYSIALTILLFHPFVPAQILGIGREHAELTRLRPATVHLANQTIMVQVIPIESRASGITERMKKLITNRIIGVNRNLREVSKDPYYLVDCSITRYDYSERTEKKKLLMVKEQGTFKIITGTLEASYKVIRVNGNTTLFGGNVPVTYKKEFQEGVETAPVRAEVEDALIRTVVDAILVKLINTEEKIKVRLMGKGELSRFARLAQAGQWVEYIESIKSLPEQKADQKGESSFEGDRHYDLSIAYEARFYDTMWKDYKRAQQYFDLADSALRKARQYDPRENEYVNGIKRLAEAKQYFETIKERFPKDFDVATHEGSRGQLGTDGSSAQPAAQGAMTNKDIIEMANAGVSEKLIIEQINEAKDKQFDTSTKGIIQLTTTGVSERIIDVIKSVMRRQSPPRQRKAKRP